jgi:hypothetical protein
MTKLLSKGGLFSESVSLWLKSPKNLPNDYPEHHLFRWIVIWHLFWGDLSQSEKISGVKTPLECSKIKDTFFSSCSNE